MISPNDIKTHAFLNKEIRIGFEGIEISITRFTKMEDNTEWNIPSHAHRNFELHYIYAGTGKVGLGNGIFDISEEEFYICPPFFEHSQKADLVNPMKEYCIECAFEYPELGEDENEIISLFRMINRRVCCKHRDENKNILRDFIRLDEIFSSGNSLNNWNELYVKTLFLNIIMNILLVSVKDSDVKDAFRSKNDISYQRAVSIRNFVEANYREDITVTDCARMFCLSERQIDRILTQVFQETFHEMLKKIRTNVAIKLMQTTDDSVESIAKEVGFSGYRQMLRSFKGYGINRPARLRMEYKQKDEKNT